MSIEASRASKAEATKSRFYPETAAGGFSRVDGTIQFYTRINALVLPEHTVLDIGAGRGAAHLDDPVPYRRALRNFKGKARKVIGIDVDTAISTNVSLDEARVIVGPRFPVDDESIDVAFSDSTFEHISDPQTFCSEIERVLKPGGWLCARTPNKHGYISVASRLVPNRLHQRVLRTAQPGRKDEDVFPTEYKLNTRRDIERFLPAERWQHQMYTWNAEPAYFGASPLAWRMAMIMFACSPASLGATWLIFSRKAQWTNEDR